MHGPGNYDHSNASDLEIGGGGGGGGGFGIHVSTEFSWNMWTL